MKSPQRKEREQKCGELIHIFDFLEPRVPEGIGSAQAPPMGEDRPEPPPEEDVWFADAAEQVPLEAPTVLVSDELIRCMLEAADQSQSDRSLPPPPPMQAWEQTRRTMPPPVEALRGASVATGCPVETREVEAEFDPDDEFGLDSEFRTPWRTKLASIVSPLAMASSALAIALSVAALNSRHDQAAPFLEDQISARTILVLPTLAIESQNPATNQETLPAGSVLSSGGVSARMAPREAFPESPARRRLQRSIRAPTASSVETRNAPFARLLRNGRARFDRGRYQTALSWYARAAALAPNEPRAHFGMALAAFELGDDSLAARTLESIVSEHPGHEDSHLLLGFLRQTEGSRQAAIEHYRHYLSLAPDGEWAEEVNSVLSTLTP